MLVEIVGFLLSPLFSLFEPYISRTTNAITSQKTQRAAIKTILASGVIFVLITVAFFAYLGFYMIYVPKIAHAKPIYLQYQKENSPYAIVDFTESGLYDSFLTADQAYDVSIDLDVPTSDKNIALGNFMIGLELIAKNETVQYSSRPCILTYQSGLFRIINTFWRLVPLLLGFTKEDQKLEIMMFENMIESAEKPITKALVTISNGNLDVYSTRIRLDAHFRGLRYFMYYHSISTAIVFMFVFLTWEVIFSIIAWKSFVSWWQNKVEVHTDIISTPKSKIMSSEDVDNFIDNYSDSQLDDRVERQPDDRETVTESESEYETSRPASVISPTDTAFVSESGEMSYNTESFATDDDESHSIVTRTDDNSSILTSETDEAEDEGEDEYDDDDDQTEGSLTPTSRRSRKSTISETSKKSEDGNSVISDSTSTTRLQSGQSGSTRPTFSRRSGSSVGNNDE